MFATRPSANAGAPQRGSDPDLIAGEIRAAQARATVRFRVIFIATWIVLIGGVLAALSAGGKFDGVFLQSVTPYILGGIGLTILISIASIAFAIFFALLGALGRLSRSAPPYAVATLYVSLVRGTPLLVQIYFVFLALPQIVPAAADVPLVPLGIFALAFNYGAYMTEIFRAGIQAVPRGQREAAEALGMPERLVMRRIVLPQAVRIVIPAIGNEFISMLKDSSLISVIGVQELLWRAQTVGSAKFRSLETLTLAAAVYWALTIVFSIFQARLEKRLAQGDR
jgi:polar amino acid transport system permease protein